MITGMHLGTSSISWCHSIKYLCVTVQSWSFMKVDSDVITSPTEGDGRLHSITSSPVTKGMTGEVC